MNDIFNDSSRKNKKYQPILKATTYEPCENPLLPLQLVPIVPAQCEPTRDNSTLLPIQLASLSLKIHLQEEIAGSSVPLIHCPVSVVTITIIEELIQEPVPDADVT